MITGRNLAEIYQKVAEAQARLISVVTAELFDEFGGDPTMHSGKPVASIHWI